MNPPIIVVFGQAAPEAQAAITEQPPAPGIVPQAPKGSGLGPGATNTTVVLSLLFVLVLVGWYCCKHMSAKLTHALVFVSIGVVGATGLVGQVVWSLLSVIISVVSQIRLG